MNKCAHFRESLSSIVYYTLWFDLNNISGLENIKYLEQIKNDYATYVDVFIENKENINKDIISEFIGSSKEL